MQSLIEQFLQEKKDHLIDRLSNVSSIQKTTLKDFFNKHPNLESKIDWNRKDLTMGDFEPLINQQSMSHSSIKNQQKFGDLSGLWKKRTQNDFEIIWQNETDIYVAPFSWQCAMFMNSFQCYRIGAKWCIGYEKDDSHWKEYVKNRENIFLFRFSKQLNEKFMFQINYKDLGRYDLKIWTADDEMLDEDDGSDEFYRALGPLYNRKYENWRDVDEAFDKVDRLYQERVLPQFALKIDIDKFLDKAYHNVFSSGTFINKIQSMKWQNGWSNEEFENNKYEIFDEVVGTAIYKILKELKFDAEPKEIEEVENNTYLIEELKCVFDYMWDKYYVE